jgi:hypothetical protein
MADAMPLAGNRGDRHHVAATAGSVTITSPDGIDAIAWRGIRQMIWTRVEVSSV